MGLNMETMLKIIPDFDGNSTKLHKFIACCETVHNPLEKESDKELFLSVLKAKLSGRAYDLVKFNDYTSWEELKKDINVNFSDTHSIEYLQVELVKAKQQRSESVRIFASRIEDILSKLNEVCIAREGKEATKYIQHLNNTTALRSFQDGLNDPVKLIVKACRFTTLKDAISKAIEEESSFQEKNSQHSNITQFNQNAIKCQLCQKIGHTATNCFSLSRKPANISFTPQNRQNAIRQINITCAFCKIPGHHIRNCRKKKYSDNYHNRLSSNVQGPSNIDQNPSLPSTSKIYTNSNMHSSENLNPLDQELVNGVGRVQVKNLK